MFSVLIFYDVHVFIARAKCALRACTIVAHLLALDLAVSC